MQDYYNESVNEMEDSTVNRRRVLSGHLKKEGVFSDHSPTLKKSVDLLTLYGLYYKHLGCTFVACLFMSILVNGEAIAVPKLTIVLKPNVTKAFYHVEIDRKMLHFSALLVGARGEPISNTKVTLDHECLVNTTILSGFDGALQTELALVSSLSPRCESWWERLELMQKFTYLVDSSLSRQEPARRYKSHRIWRQLSMSPITTGETITFQAEILESSMNSAQSLRVECEQEPSLLMITPTLNRVSKSDPISSARIRVIVSPNLAASRLGGFLKELEITFDTQLLKNSPAQGETIERSFNIVEREFSYARLNNEHESTMTHLFNLDYFEEYRVQLQVGQRGRLIDDINDQRPSSMKDRARSEWNGVAELGTITPVLSLVFNEVSTHIFDHKLDIAARLKVEGLIDDEDRVKSYIQESVVEDKVQLLLSWRARSQGGEVSQWQSQQHAFDEHGEWSKLILLPRGEETQLQVELITRDSRGQWTTRGKPQMSDWLLSPLDGQWWPLLTICLISLFWGVRILRSRLSLSEVLEEKVIKSGDALVMRRITHQERAHLKLSETNPIVILDAITQRTLEGVIYSIKVQRLGGPRRWEPEFQSLLGDIIQQNTPQGEMVDLALESYYWVTADGYEPLLAHVPQGDGCLILPLWPVREALGRIWSDCLADLGVKQVFGRGDLHSFKQQLLALDDLRIIDIADHIERSLFKRRRVDLKTLYHHLSQLQELIQSCTSDTSFSSLYPPSDYMRGAMTSASDSQDGEEGALS